MAYRQTPHKPVTSSELEPPLVCLRDVHKDYTSLAGEVRALRGINLQVRQGEFTVITGKSGSGKTTLINMITGLDRCTSGEIEVGRTAIHRLKPDQAATWRRRHIGVVFQTFELIPSLTVLQNVMLPMDFAGFTPPSEQYKRAMNLLDQMDITGHANKYPAEVSGGQQQRIAIARAMANDPEIVIADEPTGSLDSATAAIILQSFIQLVQSGKTILVATHDEDIRQLGNHVITLLDGLIIEEMMK